MALVNCPECGKEISSTSSKCIHCGYILKKRRSKENRRIISVILIILLVLLALFTLWKFVFPDIFTSAETLLKRGDYQLAYDRANDEEQKNLIKDENIIAYACKEVVDSLKDPTSFILSEALYKPEKELLLEVGGKNGYGGYVTNYWIFDYNENRNQYEYQSYLASLEQEETYSWDDADESYQKAKDNLKRIQIQKDILLGAYTFLPDENIANINNLFSLGMLDKVELITVTENEIILSESSEAQKAS